MKLSDEELLRLGFDRKAFMATPLSSSYDHDEPTSLYVMQTQGYHKIGIAADVQKRLDTVRTHNPHRVTVVHTIHWQSRLLALLVERTVHKTLRPYHVSGEWFYVDFPTIKQVLLPIAAAARVLRERHLLERAQARAIWERENPHWREMGEDYMAIPANIYQKGEDA
jgi:hypothetical protein